MLNTLRIFTVGNVKKVKSKIYLSIVKLIIYVQILKEYTVNLKLNSLNNRIHPNVYFNFKLN